MPLRLELKSSTTGPGYALLTVTGWNQAAGSIELSVQRNQDGRFLDESGDWTTNPVWHDVSVLEENEGNLSGEMGPWLVDPLVINPQVAYMFELRSPDHKDKGVLRIMGQVLSSQAAGNSVRQEARSRPPQATPAPPQPVAPPIQPVEPTPEPAVEPAPEIIPEPVAEQQPVAPEPVAPAPPPPVLGGEPETAPLPEKKRSMMGILIALLALLLLVGGGAAAWYMGLFASEDNLTASSGGTESGPCDSEAMGNLDDLAFVQGCLKSSPSSEQILTVIAAAKEGNHCNIAQRLYAYKAQGGDARIAMAYAREYDPDTFESGGCIESADAETAAYWYEIVVNQEPDNAEAKQRLEALSQP